MCQGEKRGNEKKRTKIRPSIPPFLLSDSDVSSYKLQHTILLNGIYVYLWQCMGLISFRIVVS
jgi:hypothetical protein